MAIIGPQVTSGSSGPGNVPTIGYSSWFVVGQTPWGIDNTWQVCQSMADFLRKYGGLAKLSAITTGVLPEAYSVETNPNVIQCYYAVDTYFKERQQGAPGVLYFCRVVATTSGPTAASATFTDGATHNTTVTSKWKGIMGSATLVTWTNPSPTAGAGYAQMKVDHNQANIHEVWDISSVYDAATASKKSELVTIALPTAGQLPITATQSKLYVGTPGVADVYGATDADHVGTVNGSNVKTGLQVFNDYRLGGGFVSIPGRYTSTARSGLSTHCSTFARMGFLGAPSGLTASTVVADIATNGADLAYWWPQVYVADQNSTSPAGGQILVDNVGHIAGLQARMDKQFNGPHKSPAGTKYPFTTALDVERASGSAMELADDGVSGLLADSNINTIRIKGNPGGVVSWGMRTLSQDQRYRQVPVRRVYHLMYYTAVQTLEAYTFDPIDGFGQLFNQVKGDLSNFCTTLWRNGSLYGSLPGRDPSPTDAFFVICDASNNPGTQIENGELHVDVFYAPTPNAEKISCTLILSVPGFVGRAQ